MDEQNQMNDISKEWQLMALETLLVHVIGGDWGQDCEFDAPDYIQTFCIRGAEFKQWNQYRGSTASLRKIKTSSLKTRQLKAGDILIEISGGGPDQPVGRTVLIDNRVIKQFGEKPVVCTNFLRLARPSQFIDSIYLNYYLHSFYLSGEVINYQGGSNNLRNLKFKDYSQIQIPIPALAEQQQIAAKLDELLAQVDSIKTRLDTIPKIMKRFRQSVLAAAVSGKLTEDWRENNRDISISQLNKIQEFWATEYSKNKKKYKTPTISLTEQALNKLPETWLATQIGFVFDVYVGATPSRTEAKFWNGSINWISSSEVAFCKITNTKEKITSEGLASASTFLHPSGTVMLAMIGQGKTRGQAAILEIEACHNQNTAALRVPSKFAVSEYLYFYLCKQYEETRRVGSGNNQQALNKTSVQSLAFPLPPIEEQTQIVRRVEQLFAYADQIEQRVKDAQKRVNNLSQAILAKAFRGELTADWRAQNPDLISGENSASALLAKIQSERDANKSSKKPKMSS